MSNGLHWIGLDAHKREGNVAKMPRLVIGRKYMKQGELTATIDTHVSLPVRVGLAIMQLGAWICGVGFKVEEESRV